MKAITVVWVARIFLVLAVCLAAMNPAYAGPANPERSNVAQLDGTTFQAIMRGDEFQGWMETDDGYTIVKNSATGFFEYATQGSGGELIPSGIPVAAGVEAQMTAQGLMPLKGLRLPRNTALKQYQGEFLDAIGAARQIGVSEAVPALTGTWAPTQGVYSKVLPTPNSEEPSTLLCMMNALSRTLLTIYWPEEVIL